MFARRSARGWSLTAEGESRPKTDEERAGRCLDPTAPTTVLARDGRQRHGYGDECVPDSGDRRDDENDKQLDPAIRICRQCHGEKAAEKRGRLGIREIGQQAETEGAPPSCSWGDRAMLARSGHGFVPPRGVQQQTP